MQRQVDSAAAGHRTLGLLLGLLVVCAVAIFLVFNATGRSGHGSSQDQPAGTVAGSVSSTSGAAVTAANARKYTIGTGNLGVMQPSVGKEGNIWFGEMFANALARLDPATGATASWTPPHGEDNVMATAIDQRGNVWIASAGNPNYVGVLSLS